MLSKVRASDECGQNCNFDGWTFTGIILRSIEELPRFIFQSSHLECCKAGMKRCKDFPWICPKSWGRARSVGLRWGWWVSLLLTPIQLSVAALQAPPWVFVVGQKVRIIGTNTRSQGWEGLKARLMGKSLLPEVSGINYQSPPCRRHPPRFFKSHIPRGGEKHLHLM